MKAIVKSYEEIEKVLVNDRNEHGLVFHEDMKLLCGRVIDVMHHNTYKGLEYKTINQDSWGRAWYFDPQWITLLGEFEIEENQAYIYALFLKELGEI